MISIDDYKVRTNKLFERNRERWKKRLLKSLPKGVTLQLSPSEILPYTRIDFQRWLWGQIQLGAILCPYCRAAIDVLSMELDHVIPLKRSGGPGLDNLEVICARCNKVKGELTGEEYKLVVAFLEGPGAHFRQRIEGILINGGVGNMLRNFPRHAKKSAGAKVRQNWLDFEVDEF